MYFKGEKICLITGANSGIGKASAAGLAKLGATVILVSRNHTRGERTLSELSKKTGSTKLQLMVADLSSISSIVSLVSDVKRRFERIDVLINNAGALFSRRHETVDGIEATFAVNYLSRFLLTNLLIDRLLQSKQGRVINVSDDQHRRGGINFDDINLTKNYSLMKAVRQAALADILFVYKMSSELSDTGVTINAVHPGLVSTNIIYNDPDSSLPLRAVYKLLTPFLSSPEKGAETVLYLASSPEVNRVSGKYFIAKKCVRSSVLSYEQETADRLWRVSEQMLNKEFRFGRRTLQSI